MLSQSRAIGMAAVLIPVNRHLRGVRLHLAPKLLLIWLSVIINSKLSLRKPIRSFTRLITDRLSQSCPLLLRCCGCGAYYVGLYIKALALMPLEDATVRIQADGVASWRDKYIGCPLYIRTRPEEESLLVLFEKANHALWVVVDVPRAWVCAVCQVGPLWSSALGCALSLRNRYFDKGKHGKVA